MEPATEQIDETDKSPSLALFARSTARPEITLRIHQFVFDDDLTTASFELSEPASGLSLVPAISSGDPITFDEASELFKEIREIERYVEDQ